MKIEIDMTDAEVAALSLIAPDVPAWIDNVVTERARIARDELRQQPEWPRALASAARAGVDIEDVGAVLLHGLSEGLIDTAAQRHEKALAAAVPAHVNIPISAEGVPETISHRQFAQGLAKRGLIKVDEAMAWVRSGTLPAVIAGFVEALPEDVRVDAEFILCGATSFQRSHPLTVKFGEASGMTAGDLDELWRYCSRL